MKPTYTIELIQAPLVLAMDLALPTACPDCEDARTWAEFLLRHSKVPSPHPEKRLNQVQVGIERMLRVMPSRPTRPRDTHFREMSHLHPPHHHKHQEPQRT